MNFQIWKTQRHFQDKSFRFSLMAHMGAVPVILEQEQFEGLFPTIDHEKEIPMAPGKVEIEIDVRLVV